jgi:hypothetical protein
VHLTLSSHARQRLQERGIELADVERIIASPDVTYPDRDGRPQFVGVLPDDRRVRIVMDRQLPHVVTIMWQFDQEVGLAA